MRPIATRTTATAQTCAQGRRSQLARIIIHRAHLSGESLTPRPERHRNLVITDVDDDLFLSNYKIYTFNNLTTSFYDFMSPSQLHLHWINGKLEELTRFFRDSISAFQFLWFRNFQLGIVEKYAAKKYYTVVTYFWFAFLFNSFPLKIVCQDRKRFLYHFFKFSNGFITLVCGNV